MFWDKRRQRKRMKEEEKVAIITMFLIGFDKSKLLSPRESIIYLRFVTFIEI